VASRGDADLTVTRRHHEMTKIAKVRPDMLLLGANLPEGAGLSL